MQPFQDKIERFIADEQGDSPIAEPCHRWMFRGSEKIMSDTKVQVLGNYTDFLRTEEGATLAELDWSYAIGG